MRMFWLGSMFASALLGTFEDWLGKDRFIVYASSHWFYTPWWLDASVALLAIWLAIRLRRTA